MATDIGKVGMVVKGNYNSANSYETLDIVFYDNSSYIATQDVSAGIDPSNTSYWQKALASPIINHGLFRIPLTANTYTQVNASIIEGTLPINAQNTIFKIYAASNSTNFNTRVYSETSDIYAWTDTAQTYVVKWYELAY